MKRGPISNLVRLATMLASPEAERRTYVRNLVGGKHWTVLLLTHGRKGEPPEKPRLAPMIRINPEFLARSGTGLAPEDLLYQRIVERLRAHTQDRDPLDAAQAASLATSVAVKVLAEFGVDVADLKAPEVPR